MAAALARERRVSARARLALAASSAASFAASVGASETAACAVCRLPLREFTLACADLSSFSSGVSLVVYQADISGLYEGVPDNDT